MKKWLIVWVILILVIVTGLVIFQLNKPFILQIDPNGGAGLLDSPSMLGWSPVTDAVNYSIQISDDQTFRTIIYEFNPDMKSLGGGGLAGQAWIGSRLDYQLPQNKIYWWRINVLFKDGTNRWTAPTNFKVGHPNPIFDKYCTLTDKGFVCILNEKQTYEISLFSSKCNESGGLWFRGFDCAGICVETDEYFCNYPYSDGGETCRNSEECEGLCIFDKDEGERIFEEQDHKYSLECLDCIGKCEFHPPRDPLCCYFELNNTRVIYHMVIY
jgi:hypothetical protein